MRLYNVSPSPEIVGGANNPAILPGDGGEFDDETAAYLLNTGRWSQEDPRAGLDAELAFKAERDAQAEAPAEAQIPPAVPDDQGATE